MHIVTANGRIYEMISTYPVVDSGAAFYPGILTDSERTLTWWHIHLDTSRILSN